MEHPGEIWQELDYNGERMGGVDPIEYSENRARLTSGATVMLYRYRDGEVEFLFQRRSKKLRENPDTWDTSAGGHVNLNEERIDAVVREAYEEIGVKIDAGCLELAAIYRRWKAMITLYFYDWGDREDEFSFDDQEVEEVKWVKYSEFDKFLPKLKDVARNDIVFMHYLDEWNEKIIEKYGNLQTE